MRRRAEALAMYLGQKAIQGVWDGVWESLFEAVEEAEEKIADNKEKKQYAIDKVMERIDEETTLGMLKGFVVRFFLSKVIDGLVAFIQDELGSDWLKDIQDNLQSNFEYIS